MMMKEIKVEKKKIESEKVLFRSILNQFNCKNISMDTQWHDTQHGRHSSEWKTENETSPPVSQDHLLHHSACWLVHFFLDQWEAATGQSLLLRVLLDHQLPVQIHTHRLEQTYIIVVYFLSGWISIFKAFQPFIVSYRTNVKQLCVFTWSWTRKCSTSP